MKAIALIIAIIFSSQAMAFPPVGAVGQGQTSTLYPTVNKAPNSQITNIGGGAALIETGNNNLLANPGFEHSTFNTSWTQTTGSSAVETSSLISGAKSYKATLSSQTLELYQDSTRYQANFSGGVNGVASVWVKTTVSGIFVCPRQAGSNQLYNCATVDNSGVWMEYKVPYVLGATSNGIVIVSGTMSSGTVTTGAVTGDVYVDDAYVGVGGASPASIITPWQSYTPTFTGFGTVSASTIKWRQVGSSIQIQGQFIPGTPTATEARITLPNNYTSASDYPSGTTIVGGGASTVTNNAIVSLIETSKQYVVFGIDNSANAASNKVNGNGFTIAGSTVSFFAEVRVAELNGSTGVFATGCGAACETEYSAQITSAGVVTYEGGGDWINGNCSVSTNTFTCTLNRAQTRPLVCTSGVLDSENPGYFPNFTNTTTAVVYVPQTTGGTGGTHGTMIKCSKVGEDYIASRTIVGSFKDAITSPGTVTPVVYSSRIGSPNCSSSPCTIDTQYGASWLSTVTRSGTGAFTATISSGKFSSTPSCYGGSNSEQTIINATSSTSVTIICKNGSGTAQDCQFHLNCFGVR